MCLLSSIVIAALMIVASFSMMASIGSPINQPEKASVSAYAPHTPIYINSNSGFTNASGVVWGSGTALDPYIIRGWSIDASGYAMNPIYLLNTNSYFRVEDCYLYDTGKSAILLSGVSHGSLTNNNCSNSVKGIELSGSSNNVISDNICSYDSLSGIYLDGSDGNIVVNNNCSYSQAGVSGNGIYLLSSSNNILANNSCLHNYRHGIDVIWGGGNTIVNNNCMYNGDQGINIGAANLDTIRDNNCSYNGDCGINVDDSSNTILIGNIGLNNDIIGISIRGSDHSALSNNTCMNHYLAGICIDSYDGSSKFNNIVNNTCSDNQYGIFLWQWSSNNTLIGNNCSRNDYGMYLVYARNNEITDNIVSDNNGYGIYIKNGNPMIPNYISSNNTVWNNTFIGNNGGNAQACDDGMNNLWNISVTHQGYGNYWSDWSSPDNNSDGIVDAPYSLNGCSGGKDYRPLVSPPSIDTTPPFTTFSISGAPGLNGWYVSDMIITLNATDNCSGIDHTYWRLGQESTSFEYTAPITLYGEGPGQNLTFWSFDKAGIEETYRAVQIKIDLRAPISLANNSGHMVTISALDNASGINRTMYRIDNSTWLTYNGSFNVTAAGNHTIEYYSIDNAGNGEGINVLYIDNGKILYIDNGIDMVLMVLIAALIASVIIISLLLIRKKRAKSSEIASKKPAQPQRMTVQRRVAKEQSGNKAKSLSPPANAM